MRYLDEFSDPVLIRVSLPPGSRLLSPSFHARSLAMDSFITSICASAGLNSSKLPMADTAKLPLFSPAVSPPTTGLSIPP